jgi:hypothetical protein
MDAFVVRFFPLPKVTSILVVNGAVWAGCIAAEALAALSIMSYGTCRVIWECGRRRCGRVG